MGVLLGLLSMVIGLLAFLVCVVTVFGDYKVKHKLITTVVCLLLMYLPFYLYGKIWILENPYSQ